MDCNIDSKRKPLILLAALVAAILFGVGFWAQAQYAQGIDPLAQVRSMFVTVEQTQDQPIVPTSNEEALSEEIDASQSDDSASQIARSAGEIVAAPEGVREEASAETSQQTSGSQSGQPNQSGQSNQTSGQSVAPSNKISVSISIDPGQTGIAGGSAQLTLSAGATVYDALASCGVSINAQETAMGVYVVAINGLAEKDYGPTSGWTYLVNGSMPQHACNFHELHDGDSIVWRYVNVEK